MPERRAPTPAQTYPTSESPALMLHEPAVTYGAGPTSVGSRELKTRLGAWLARVEAGEHLVVTERGRPVAELRPWRPAHDLDALLQTPAIQGRVTRQRAGAFPPGRPVAVRGAPVSQTLLDDRADRL